MKAFLLVALMAAFVLPLSVEAQTAPSASLTWQDNSANEDGFLVERKMGTGTYSEIGKLGANVTKFTDTGLLFGQTYCYRVVAYNTAGRSAPSNEACTTTPTTPPPPSGLTVTLTVQ